MSINDTHLVDESELRVSVAKILDLRLRAVEAVVALAHVALLVLPLAVGDTADREDQDADLAAKVDGVSDGVLWPVGRHVCPEKMLEGGQIGILLVRMYVPSSQNTTCCS